MSTNQTLYYLGCYLGAALLVAVVLLVRGAKMRTVDRVFAGVLAMIVLCLLFAVAAPNIDYWIAYNRYYKVHHAKPPSSGICYPGAYDGGFCLNSSLQSVQTPTPLP